MNSSAAEICGRERFRERTDAFVDAHCCAYMLAFVDESVNVNITDMSANARRRGVRERTCKLIVSVCGVRERYIALNCGQL